jgi:peroxiredoxin
MTAIDKDKKIKLRRTIVMARVELNVQAPDFTLDDFNGNSVSLSNYKNKKNVLVVFNRGFF